MGARDGVTVPDPGGAHPKAGFLGAIGIDAASVTVEMLVVDSLHGTIYFGNPMGVVRDTNVLPFTLLPVRLHAR